MIVFKGIRTDNGQFVQGDYALGKIWTSDGCGYDAKKVRQYVGENTCDGIAVWTHDVLAIKTHKRLGDITGYMEYDEYCRPYEILSTELYDYSTAKIIGNTMDDSSLSNLWWQIVVSGITVSHYDMPAVNLPQYYNEREMLEKIHKEISNIEQKYGVSIEKNPVSYVFGSSAHPEEIITFEDGMSLYIADSYDHLLKSTEENLRQYGYLK